MFNWLPVNLGQGEGVTLRWPSIPSGVGRGSVVEEKKIRGSFDVWDTWPSADFNTVLQSNVCERILINKETVTR